MTFLLEQAESHVPKLSPSFHGEMASYAYLDHRFIATEIIKQCSEEQIAIAKQKAGIGEAEQVELERFEVVRHF